MRRHDGYPENLDGHNHHGHSRKHERGAHADHRERLGRGAFKDGARGAPHERGGNEGRSYTGVQGKGGNDFATGRDAAYIEPFCIPDYELLPRDDSGGPEWQPYTGEWGDGGYVTGEKAHLSTKGGRDDPTKEDEIDQTPRIRAALRAEGEGQANPEGPSSSVRETKYTGRSGGR